MMDRDKFFAVLDQLTPSQIETRLPLWDDEQLKLVSEYGCTAKPPSKSLPPRAKLAAGAGAS
jgi:hypothetical protein